MDRKLIMQIFFKTLEYRIEQRDVLLSIGLQKAGSNYQYMLIHMFLNIRRNLGSDKICSNTNERCSVAYTSSVKYRSWPHASENGTYTH